MSSSLTWLSGRDGPHALVTQLSTSGAPGLWQLQHPPPLNLPAPQLALLLWITLLLMLM